jgi:sigma-E factor negative regulatory protein RseC
MLEETGTVLEAGTEFILVETQSRSACSHCSTDSCTTSVISKLFGVKRNRFHLENSLGAKIGDRVVIGIRDDLLVKASLWAYLLPLVVMLVCVALAGTLGVGEGWQSLVAMGGLTLGFYLVRGSTGKGVHQNRFRPQLLRLAASEQIQVELPNFFRS